MNHLVNEGFLDRLRMAAKLFGRQFDDHRAARIRDTTRGVGEALVIDDSTVGSFAVEESVVQPRKQELQFGFRGQLHKDFFLRASKRIIVSANSSSGLPPRIYVPMLVLIGGAFLCVMAYLVTLGFGVTGSVFGKSATSPASQSASQRQGSQNAVEGGPPPPIVAQVQTLRRRIAAHPDDDVALTQLGDMYLAANKFQEAIPLYRQALRVNPNNVAAQTGLSQARDALQH